MEEEPQGTGETEIPWPGPMPYEEAHYKHFVGREQQVKNLLGRAQVSRLTVLFGESGSGKTSLIRAGLVPRLRIGRYKGEGEAKGAWPTLLLREGGAKREETVEINWLRQLEAAIDAMEKWGARYGQRGAIEDAEFFRDEIVKCKERRLVKGALVDVIEGLALRQANRQDARSEAEEGSEEGSSGSGLILVFDQFEEQLRSGPVAQRDAFRLIRDLFVGGAPVNILLSMRKEFRGDLKDLEKQIGELGRNSVYLERLERPKVIQVIEKVSRSSRIKVESQVAERIVGWLTSDTDTRDERRGVEGSTDAKVSDGLDSGSPDLLKLQAVLVELCHWMVGACEVNVTQEVLQRFISEIDRDVAIRAAPSGYRERDLESRLGERVLGGALERWIEKAIRGEIQLEKPSSDKGSQRNAYYGGLTTLPEELLRPQVRRITVRIAPLLSSADYKVQQEENALFIQALGEDIAKLPLKEPMRAEEVDIVEYSDTGELRLNWEGIGGLEEPSGLKKWESLSGPARNWTAEETGNRLLACFKETLERLSSANILRRTPVGNAGDRRNYWELVHDQFGPNLVRWARNQKGTWDDCENSLVICRGIQPLSVLKTELAPGEGQLFYDVDGVSWQGCVVVPGNLSAQAQNVTFRKVRFTDCLFVGTIFDALRFEGCKFVRCLMMGGLFRDCTFDDTTFDHCDGNTAILRGTISSLEFHDCHLLQPSINGSFLTGEIRYTGATRVIQGYFDVVRAGEGERIRIWFDQDSRAAFCMAGHESFKLMRFDNLELNIANSPLREDNRVRLLGQ